MKEKPVVIIVGGGYAGVGCAKALDKIGQFFVVLIDRKSYFLHNVAALRATTEQDFAQQILVPYDRLLNNGCVIQAEVTSISSDGVQVHGRNEPIHLNYLVIVTGSSYAFPGKIAEAEISKGLNLYDNIRAKLQQSHDILIIGGGPVGIELAGEIGTDFPDKNVTLVHSQPTLLYPNIFQEKVYAGSQEQLEKLGVKIILNDRIELPNNKDSNYIEGKKTYTTQKTRTNITADLAFVCTGARINNKSLLNSPLKSKINSETGRMIVNNYLQVDGYENIFAIGDISNKEGKMTYFAAEQADYVGKLIPLIEKKKPYPKEYKTHVHPGIFLSIGRNGGIGQLPMKSGTILGSFFVKLFKSKDMLTPRTRASLNYKSKTQSENQSGYTDKVHSVQSIFSFTEQDARDLLVGFPAKNLEPGQDFI